MLFGGDAGSLRVGLMVTREPFLGVEGDEVALCKFASIEIKF
jgi:hypothetical protein